jgi:hypothetical protein
MRHLQDQIHEAESQASWESTVKDFLDDLGLARVSFQNSLSLSCPLTLSV